MKGICKRLKGCFGCLERDTDIDIKYLLEDILKFTKQPGGQPDIV